MIWKAYNLANNILARKVSSVKSCSRVTYTTAQILLKTLTQKQQLTHTCIFCSALCAMTAPFIATGSFKCSFFTIFPLLLLCASDAFGVAGGVSPAAWSAVPVQDRKEWVAKQHAVYIWAWYLRMLRAKNQFTNNASDHVRRFYAMKHTKTSQN